MNLESWITVTALLAVIACLIQIAAYVAPMWTWVSADGVYTGIGLWYIVGCSPGGSCGIIGGTILSGLTVGSVAFLVLRVLQSVAVAGVVALVVFLIVLRIGVTGGWHGMKSLNLAAFIVGVFTVVVLLSSAGVFGGYFWTAFAYVSSATYDKSSLPWSPLLSLLAAIILIVVCVFILTCCRPYSYDAGAIPMSGDTKMELNPHVQNGMVSRYYNQTPYIDDRIRYVDDYRAPRYDDRYDNRGYQHDNEPTIVYAKPTARDFRDNRDRELGHTIYTGNGMSYLKGEVTRADDVRYGRPVSLAELSPVRGHYDDYYDRNLRGGRVLTPVSTSYIYRPHQY